MEVFDPRDLRAGPGSSSNHGRQEITASMPGKVIRVLVSQGETVEEGQGLIVVEAMKMQNEMKSPKGGMVMEVRVGPDATVSAGEVLVVVE
jgi:biotin carboxyl carrier protein